MNRLLLQCAFALCLLALRQEEATCALPKSRLANGVRIAAPRAQVRVVIDGKLDEYGEAFCNPVAYWEDDVANRALQLYFLWDEEALYVAQRTLDNAPVNRAPDDELWDGDAVGLLIDTRTEEEPRADGSGSGAASLYWTALTGSQLAPRWCRGPDSSDDGFGTGVEVAATRTGVGIEMELKLPWANLPDFQAVDDAVMVLDVDLCYSDGEGRVFRRFACESKFLDRPESRPKLQLIDELRPRDYRDCGASLAPLRVDVVFGEDNVGRAEGFMALPPNHADLFARAAFRLCHFAGRIVGDFPVEIEEISSEGGFYRAHANWDCPAAPPGSYYFLGATFDANGIFSLASPEDVNVKDLRDD